MNSHARTGGATRSAYRLLQGLRGIGSDSRMLVRYPGHVEDPAILATHSRFDERFPGLRASLDYLPLRLYPGYRHASFTPAYIPDGLAKQVASLDPDVVHLHWLGQGFIRLETLREFRRPLVWTLHDMWAFTGGCHYDQECGRYQEACGQCPLLDSQSENDLSRWIWGRKSAAWAALKLAIVTPSRWLAECARKSSLFQSTRVEVIPYGMDLERYRPIPKAEARERLGLPADKQLILFAAVNALQDRRKGSEHLIAALHKVAASGWQDRLELVVMGDAGGSLPSLGLPVRALGHLSDEDRIVLAYSAADVFVAPSIQENLANTVLESLACGTPSVAFDIGGMPDMILPGRTGYLVRPFDADDLAHGIMWVIEDAERLARLSHQARSYIEAGFELHDAARRYMRLYEEVTA